VWHPEAVRLVQLRRGSSQQAASSVAPIAVSDPVDLVDRTQRRVRYLRISLLDRCNYRCTYCMPDEAMEFGAREDVLRLEEVVALAAAFARWGVQRVRLTGGEPTLRRGLVDLVGALAQVRTEDGRPLEVVMTTNGERLAPVAHALRDAGLHGLTVSLDSLDSDRFRRITRRGDLTRVREGLEAAVSAGFDHVKLNTVAIAGFNDDELAAIAQYCWQRSIVPRFIELMPMSEGATFVPGELMSAAAVRASVEKTLGAELVADDGDGVRGHGPASYWKVASGVWAGRRLGTIGALTENFCASCNRLRVSATGQLHGCLARDETGDLRAALRGGRAGDVERVVQRVLATKRDAHAFGLDGRGGPRKAMMSIGG
jgi:cyclic pyranopterin phosphate synthase